MENLWEIVLKASFYGSIVGIIILLTKVALKNKLSGRFNYLIWMILIIKLIVPIGPKSDMSIFNKIPTYSNYQSTNENKEVYELNEEDKKTEVTGTYNNYENISSWKQVAQNNMANSLMSTVKGYVPYVWIAGVINVVAVLLFSQYLLHKNIKNNNRKTNYELEEISKVCKNKMNVNKNIKVVVNDFINTPSLVGFVNPKILIPSTMTNLSNKELEYIILHELAHYKRKDIFSNYLLLILQAIHWFNPVIWYLFKRVREDMELATDERVLKILEDKEHKAYGRAILTVLERIKSSNFTPGVLGIIEDKNSIKNRIKRIKDMKSNKNKMILFSAIGVVVITLLGSILLTSAKENTTEKEDIDYLISEALINSKELELDGEVVTEGHVVLDTVEDEKSVKAYIVSSGGGFGFENGIFTKISGYGTVPLVMNFTKDEYGILQHKNTEWPQDGSYYDDSIKEMFPKKLHQDVLYEIEKYREEVDSQQESQAKAYLDKIGRDAEVQIGFVIKESIVIDVIAENTLLEDKKIADYPSWLGTRESVVDGVRYIYEKSHYMEDGYDIIVYTKKTEDNNIVEEYKYRINGSKPELINGK